MADPAIDGRGILDILMLGVKELTSQTDRFGGRTPSSRRNWLELLSQRRQRAIVVVLILLASSLTTLLFWRVLPDRFRVNEQSDYFAAYEPVARDILAGNDLSFT